MYLIFATRCLHYVMVDTCSFRVSESQAELEVQEKLSLLEWLANEYRSFGCALEFVTNKSQVFNIFFGCGM